MKKIKYLFYLIAVLVFLPWRMQAATVEVQPPIIKNQSTLAQEFEGHEGDDGYERQFNVTGPVNQQNDVNTSMQNTASSTPTIPATTVLSTTATTSTSQTVFPWAWVVTRAAGIASYLLLAMLTLTGISLSTGLLFRIFSPATAWSVHRAIASVLLISVVTHVGALLFDHFIGLKLADLLIPFVSFYRPLFVALGIFGFYLLLLVLGTSLYTMTNHPRFWRLIHYFSFPMFVLIFLHGILIGTDRHQPWLQYIYWVSAAVVGMFVIYRLFWRFRRVGNYAPQAVK